MLKHFNVFKYYSLKSIIHLYKLIHQVVFLICAIKNVFYNHPELIASIV